MEIILLIVVVLLIALSFYQFRKISGLSTSDLSQENTNLKIELSSKEQQVLFLQKKLDDIENSKEEQKKTLTTEFENLAHKILEKNSEKFKEQNKEQIGTLLHPLGLEIEKFKKKIEDTNKDYIDRNAALTQRLKSLEQLNLQLSQDAVNLTNALKGDSKVQGDWGELQLEVLLEKSGLTSGVHYSMQGGYKDEDGKVKKPDFIINLPDNKHLIIDSKVSLTAYESFSNAENEIDQNIAIKKHIESIRKHFNDLGGKDYPSLYGINSPDHVLMYVPIEPALMIALQEEKAIYLDALDKNVVLVSTSTLLATLSTIASIWKQEDQKRNVLEIAKEGGLLYDKFESFVSDLIKIGRSLQTSQESYQDAMNKLVEGRGNIVKKVENLKKLGAKTKKSLPQNIIDRSSSELES